MINFPCPRKNIQSCGTTPSHTDSASNLAKRGNALIVSANLKGNESEESGDDSHHQITNAADDINAGITPNNLVLERTDQEEVAKGRSMYF